MRLEVQKRWRGLISLCFPPLSATLKSKNNIRDTKEQFWKMERRWNGWGPPGQEEYHSGRASYNHPTNRKTWRRPGDFMTKYLTTEGSRGRLIPLLDQAEDLLTIPGEPSSVSKWDKSGNPLTVSGQGTWSPSQPGQRAPSPNRDTGRQDGTGQGDRTTTNG